MIIRNEKPSDFEAIAEVTKAAFKDHSVGQQTEHLTIDDLRADGALTISLVTEIDAQVVGHIAFCDYQRISATLTERPARL